MMATRKKGKGPEGPSWLLHKIDPDGRPSASPMSLMTSSSPEEQLILLYYAADFTWKFLM